MCERGRILVSCATTVMLLVVIVLGLNCLRNQPVHHFRVVEEGVLYRGGQPSPSALDYIINRYKIRTVVNLRGGQPDKDWWRAERDVCSRHGVRMVDVRIDACDTAACGLKQFLTVAANSDDWPVYLHCEHGSVRAGCAVAAYRIAIRGWSYDNAMREAVKLGFHPHGKMRREYGMILRELAAGLDWRELSDARASSDDCAAVDADD